MCVALEYIETMLTDKEIFSNWLKQVIKVKGVVKGKYLANDIEVDPSTISGWFGDRSKGPEPDVCIKICEVLTKKYKFPSNYDQIIEEGRGGAQVAETKIPELEDRIAALETLIPTKKITKEDYKNDIQEHIHKKNKEHHDLVDEFEQAELAYEINCLIREIEKRKKSKLKKIKRILHTELDELNEELGDDDQEGRRASGDMGES